MEFYDPLALWQLVKLNYWCWSVKWVSGERREWHLVLRYVSHSPFLVWLFQVCAETVV